MVRKRNLSQKGRRICRLNYARSTRIILPIEINVHFIKTGFAQSRPIYFPSLRRTFFSFIFKIIAGYATNWIKKNGKLSSVHRYYKYSLTNKTATRNYPFTVEFCVGKFRVCECKGSDACNTESDASQSRDFSPFLASIIDKKPEKIEGKKCRWNGDRKNSGTPRCKLRDEILNVTCFEFDVYVKKTVVRI